MDRDLRVAKGKGLLNDSEFWWLTRQVTLLGSWWQCRALNIRGLW
ncbi:hypothetical protein QZH46_19555 [Pseudomonas corrugata]